MTVSLSKREFAFSWLLVIYYSSMNTETLLKTVPVLEQQLCALIDFDANSEVLNNAIIKGAFILLFKDLVRLFACYHDGKIASNFTFI